MTRPQWPETLSRSTSDCNPPLPSHQYFEHIPVAPRCLVVPAYGTKALIDFPSSLNYKQGLLVGLTSDGTKGAATLQVGGRWAGGWWVFWRGCWVGGRAGG